LVNDRLKGTFTEVQLPLERITQVHGIMLDFDPGLLRPADGLFDPAADPRDFLTKIRPVLDRHPLVSKAEVRASGTGLHVIVPINPAIELHTATDQLRWAGAVKAVQRTLPVDPRQPGITALTRPIGSTNSKNGVVVELLRTSQAVTAEEVEAYLADLVKSPFRVVAGVLLGGERIVPCPVWRKDGSRLDVLERGGKCYRRCGRITPPILRMLLRESCWSGDADLVNALALLLTGLLINHFITEPHPVAILDGNQKGVGKTLLVEILDGRSAPRISLVGDEELEKKLSAHVQESRTSVLFFDNVRGRFESSVIERNALSPVLSFRLLGLSATVTRPNSFVWVITSNGTQATEDLISRGLPMRLHFAGDPKKREFAHEPLRYVREHREEILGELAGMVLAWKQAGIPLGTHKHRCDRWARFSAASSTSQASAPPSSPISTRWSSRWTRGWPN
jgi:hypothetical protein